MATKFEIFIDHRLKLKGRQDIDENTIRENNSFGYDHYPQNEPQTLRIDWPGWLKKAENNFKTTYGETELENHERCRRFIHHYLEDIFILESNVIRVCYEEFYLQHLFYDEGYFNKIKTDFRKFFKSDFRLPELSYFDDLIEEIETKYKPNETNAIKEAEPENQHPRIFSNGYAWELFKHWMTAEGGTGIPKTDAQYGYIVMKENNLIHEGVTKKEFKYWLNETFNIDLKDTFRPMTWTGSNGQLYRIDTDARRAKFKKLLNIFKH